MRGKEFADRRDEAIVRLFVDTGMRVSEMCGIRLLDLDMRADQVTVHGKGDRIRILPFGARAGTALERYLRLRARHKLAGLPWLWPGSRGREVTPSGVYAMAQGMGDDATMRLFGWRSLTMLNRYGAAVADERARGASSAFPGRPALTITPSIYRPSGSSRAPAGVLDGPFRS